MTEIELALNRVRNLLNQIGYQGCVIISNSDQLVWLDTEFVQKHSAELKKVGLRRAESQEFNALRHKAMSADKLAFRF